MRRAIFLVALFPSLLFGQNILTNPGFDASLSGWTNQGGVFSTLDAASATSSGSVQLTHPVTGLVPQITQCRVGVAPGVYSAGVKYRIPAGQTAGVAVLRVWTFTTNNCSGNFQEVRGQEYAPTQFDTWLSAQMLTRVPDGAGSTLFQIFVQRNDQNGPAFTGFFDDAFLVASDAALPLGAFGRFLVEATWETPDQSTGAGHSRLLTNDSGYFWFFDSANIELVVKVLDGCGVNNRFWVFAAGLTNVKVVLKVTDRTKGTVKTYTNPLGTAFAPIQDTGAFVCP